jgi:limonene-1,2-epoxide hydrolase
MSDSPESVVREFLAAWADPKADALAKFFDDAAVWVDGAQGVHRGANAIASELATQLAISHPITIKVITLVANGGTVMAEWRDDWTMGGKPISTTVMAAFEIGANGRINRWRESYDMKSIMDQIEAAGYKAPNAASGSPAAPDAV